MNDINPEALSDLLGLVIEGEISTAVVASWSPEQRCAVERWAIGAVLEANDNDVASGPMPGFLRDYLREVHHARD